MLTVIPGLSEQKAASIVLKYPSIKSLITAYRKCKDNEQCEALLKDIKIKEMGKPKKEKKLGLAMSKKVCTFLYSTDKLKRIQS